MTRLAKLLEDEPLDHDFLWRAPRNALRAQLRPLLIEPASFTEAEREALKSTALGRKTLRVVAELEAERDSYKNQAEYERQARIDAANFPRNRHGYIPCHRCGIDCGMDAIIPDAVWAKIAPIPEWPEAGMLCLWCMDELLVEAGIEGPVEVKLYFPGKVLVSAPYGAALTGEEA